MKDEIIEESARVRIDLVGSQLMQATPVYSGRAAFL
jgi:hypothetical protein